jgi:hypothetical protein
VPGGAGAVFLEPGDILLRINGVYGARYLDTSQRVKSVMEFHAYAPLEATMRVTNGIPLG